MIGIDLLSLFGKTTLLWQRWTVTVCHEGWPRDWWGRCFATNILPVLANLLFRFQTINVCYVTR